MKKIIPVTLISCLLLCFCGEKSPATPTPVRECEKNQTAKVQFENRSGSNTTYDVIWDGSKLTTLTPGTTSQSYTQPVGQHTLQFRIANTNKAACTQSTPNLGQCEEHLFWCSF